jgi:hypothetical protein
MQKQVGFFLVASSYITFTLDADVLHIPLQREKKASFSAKPKNAIPANTAHDNTY